MTSIDDYCAAFDEEPGYLDFARLGPLARAVTEEQRLQSEFLARARFGSLDHVLEQDGRVQEAVATHIGFSPEQIAFQPDTSTGLMHAMFGLSGEVAMSPLEFPSMRYAAVRAQQAIGRLTPVWLETEHDRVTPGTLRDQLTPEITAVAVSLVDYRTGFMVDLEGIRQVIGERLLIVDAIQGFGVVDAPWEVADIIASGGQKWARAGMGTGFLAVSDRALERLIPLMSGWSAASDRVESDPVEDARSEAAAFRITHANPVAEARLAAAVEAIDEVGVDAISGVVSDKVDRLIDLLDEFALPIVSPRDPQERAGIVVTAPPAEQFTVLSAALFNHGISVSQRDGSIRFSVHVSSGEETFELLRQALLSFTSAVNA